MCIWFIRFSGIGVLSSGAAMMLFGFLYICLVHFLLRSSCVRVGEKLKLYCSFGVNACCDIING